MNGRWKVGTAGCAQNTWVGHCASPSRLGEGGLADCRPQRQWLERRGVMRCRHSERHGIMLTAATRDSDTSGFGNGNMVMSLVTSMKHRKVMKVSQFEGRMKGFVWMS